MQLTNLNSKNEKDHEKSCNKSSTKAKYPSNDSFYFSYYLLCFVIIIILSLLIKPNRQNNINTDQFVVRYWFKTRSWKISGTLRDVIAF